MSISWQLLDSATSWTSRRKEDWREAGCERMWEWLALRKGERVWAADRSGECAWRWFFFFLGELLL